MSVVSKPSTTISGSSSTIFDSKLSLEEEELNVVFDYFTQENAVENFNAYFAVRDKAIAEREAKQEEEVKEAPKKAEDAKKAEAPKEKTQTPQKKEAVKKAKKGILNILFSRVFILAALVLIQLYVLAATVTFLQEYATYIYAGFLVLGVITVIYMINNSSNPDIKITWMLLIMVTPIIGSVFYLFVKTQPGTAVLEKSLTDLNKATKPYMLQDKGVLEDFRTSKPANANLATYLNNQISRSFFV